MKTVFATLADVENYNEFGGDLLYYDSPEQLYEYEGDVEFIELTIYDIRLN